MSYDNDKKIRIKELKKLAQKIKSIDDTLLDAIGNLTSLNTSDKSSLVVAINELLTQRGALSGLNTTNKASIIAAINELVSADASMSSTVTTLNTRTNIFKYKPADMRNSIPCYTGHTSHTSFTDAELAAIQSEYNDTLPVGYGWEVPGTSGVKIAGFDYFRRNSVTELGTHHAVCVASFTGEPYHTGARGSNPRYTTTSWYNGQRLEILQILEDFFGAENMKNWTAEELLFDDTTHEVIGNATFTGRCELPTMSQVTGWPPLFNGKMVQPYPQRERRQLPLFRHSGVVGGDPKFRDVVLFDGHSYRCGSSAVPTMYTHFYPDYNMGLFTTVMFVLG